MNALPASVFPAFYDLTLFKREVLRHLSVFWLFQIYKRAGKLGKDEMEHVMLECMKYAIDRNKMMQMVLKEFGMPGLRQEVYK